MSSIQQLSFLPDAEVDTAAPPIVDDVVAPSSIEVAPQRNTAPAEKHLEASTQPVALMKGLKPRKAISSNDERYLSVKEVGARYSISVQTVWRHTKQNPDFPKPVKILNGSTRWRMSDILAFEVSRQEVSR